MRLALLDFSIPRGLQFSISKAPNPQFQTSYRLNVLPSLSGSIGYIFSSCGLDLKSSGDVRFKDVVDRFKVYQIPKRPEGKEEEWLAGKRVDTRGASILALIMIMTPPQTTCRLLAVWAALHPYRPITGFLYHTVVTNAPSVYILHK